MKEYTKRETQIIIAWAKECKFEGAFDLSKAELIEDVQMFLDAEVCQIQAHEGNPVFNSSIDRLYRLKKALEEAGK